MTRKLSKKAQGTLLGHDLDTVRTFLAHDPDVVRTLFNVTIREISFQKGSRIGVQNKECAFMIRRANRFHMLHS